MGTTNRIDFKAKKFTSCGVVYHIDPDVMSYERIKIFNSFIPELAFGIDISDVEKFANDLIGTLMKGSDMATNYVKAADKAINFQKRIKSTDWESFFDTNVEQHLRFCALFCNTEGEDTNVFSKAVMDRKVENWKRDMNIRDFFLLTMTQLPNFKSRLEGYYTESLQENPK